MRSKPLLHLMHPQTQAGSPVVFNTHQLQSQMAKLLLLRALKAIIYLLLLAVTLRGVNSARILDEADAPEVSDDPTAIDVAPVAVPIITSPDDQTPTATGAAAVTPIADMAPSVVPNKMLPSGPAPVAAPSATAAPGADVPDVVAPPVTNVAPLATPAAGSAGGTTGAANTGAQADPEHPALSFFMHDILGGTKPSGRVVTGVVANSDINGLPFSKPNSQVFPINGGVPLVNSNNGVINDNNVPFLAGLNGSPSNTVIQNSGNNNVVSGGNNQPFVTAGQLPPGTSLQQLMFGSITVVDNELTEGHELGSAVLGKAQGFYLASSIDGSSHTLVLTALFHGNDHEVEDTISFFGIHRTATPQSEIAVVGGTGKYENAKGHATIETLLHHEDQHTTDGVETITQFSVYLTL